LLAELGYRNIDVRIGDGYRGWPEAAPFDAILVTAAPDHVPQRLVDQLAPGGRLVIPVGPHGGRQELLVITKARDGRTVTRKTLAVRFVPLTR
jgi:protein-L-isoaspartate(D-aspartate) O-methyltransferase